MNIPKYFYFKINVNKKENEIIIEDASDLDVAEVIRCNKCKWFEEYIDGTGYCFISRNDMWPDDFCSYGERAEEC